MLTIDIQLLFIHYLKTIWEHENYTTTAEFVYNDISIIEMETAAVLSENVAPICAPLNESYAYVAATVSGWGTTNKIGSKLVA